MNTRSTTTGTYTTAISHEMYDAAEIRISHARYLFLPITLLVF